MRKKNIKRINHGSQQKRNTAKKTEEYEKMKAESVWSDEQSRWKVPDLVVQKTKLPPAGRPC